jgi:hypothetical protein
MFRQHYAQLRANKGALWLVGGDGDGRAFLALVENNSSAPGRSGCGSAGLFHESKRFGD